MVERKYFDPPKPIVHFNLVTITNPGKFDAINPGRETRIVWTDKTNKPLMFFTKHGNWSWIEDDCWATTDQFHLSKVLQILRDTSRDDPDQIRVQSRNPNDPLKAWILS